LLAFYFPPVASLLKPDADAAPLLVAIPGAITTN